MFIAKGPPEYLQTRRGNKTKYIINGESLLSARKFGASYWYARTAFNLLLVCFKVYLLNSVDQIPSWEAICFLTSQEIPRILWKL
jgi:hypothetical protein